MQSWRTGSVSTLHQIRNMEFAIFEGQLSAAMKLIPADVLEDMSKE